MPQLILLDPDRLQEIIEPLDGAVLRVGSTNRFLANLTVFFPVHSIDLLVNGVKANDPRMFPYLIWIPTNLGLHRLQAVMADRSGVRLTSGPVTVTIADVRPPSLIILAPAHKSSFARDAAVTIRASATDPHGQITNMTAVVTGIETWISQGPTIEGTVSNITSGWHRTEVRAVNDSAQTTRGYVEFFVAHEINPDLLVPEGFAVEANAADSVTLTWKPPTPKGAAVWLTTEQKPAGGEWIEIGGCPAEDGEFVAGQLEADTSYDFRIAFLDKNQRRSAYSAIVNLRTPPWRNATAQSPTKRPR